MNRIIFYTIFIVFLVLITPTLFAASLPHSQEKPNIIFILADDLGYGDLGSYGQKKIKTPNLDRMAAEGMRFTQFYSGSTVCRPARCTLMTGLHTGHCYARANIKFNLRPEDVTIAEMLKEKNYVSAIIGKWALGRKGSTGTPNRKGFDYFYGYLSQKRAHNYYPEYLYRNTEKVLLDNKVPDKGSSGQGVATVRKEYSNDLFTGEALKFIEENRDEPFFLYLPYTIPHANTDAGDEGLEVPSLGEYEKLDWPKPQKAYAAMVTRLDSYVGSILEELKKQGIEKNTIVFFSSDNGPHTEAGNDPEFFSSKLNLRGIKRDLYEGGIRVPLIAWGPGLIKGGSVSEHIAYFPDVLPTIMEMSGINIRHQVDGISFYPALAGDTDNQKNHDFLYWEYHSIGGSRALRTGKWKSVIRPYNGIMELFDLSNDVEEQFDVAEDNKDVVLQHKKILEREHEDLPFKDAIRLYLKREQINKHKLLNAIVLVIVLLLVSGYVLFRKKRKKASQ